MDFFFGDLVGILPVGIGALFGIYIERFRGCVFVQESYSTGSWVDADQYKLMIEGNLYNIPVHDVDLVLLTRLSE